ncbi:ATP-binding protein [Yersinia massiliensis]|uniref:ATP-binding protein n=1 Tax=Yersinia massiliensis TaxID=419257 RepID=UPI00031F384D|nr:transporter substrate-binding domain-containing protein [Yersinia massiliensis]MCB5309654.1 transporter substrate-binding domain-containing protein [Yersinia massiliensis]
MTLRKAILMLSLLLLAVICHHAAANGEPLHLQGRSHVDGYKLDLTENDWRFLREHKILRLGTALSDYPPLDISLNNNYEGISADYAALLADLLHVKIEVLQFPTRAQAVQALKEGKIDLLSSSSTFEAKKNSLILSGAYVESEPVLVTRVDDNQHPEPEPKADLAGQVVAMSYDDPLTEIVRKVYPQADVQLFPNQQSALGAVAFGQADAYMGDMIGADYMADNIYLNSVNLIYVTSLGEYNFAFALAPENTHLQSLINIALKAIPSHEKDNILRNWAADVSIIDKERLNLSPAEKRWIEKHPQVDVTVSPNLAPLTFFDSEGSFRGITANLLTEITARTGLKFDISQAENSLGMIEQIKKGDAGMSGGILSSTALNNELSVTRPYLTSPIVLISSINNRDIQTLADMDGKRLAIARSYPWIDYIQTNYPKIIIVKVDSLKAGMDSVVNGQSDATLNLLLTGSYLISNQYRNKLQVVATVGTDMEQIAFAMSRSSVELQSIMNKALLSITPEEMHRLTTRWHTKVFVDDSYWFKNRTFITNSFAITVLLLVFTLVWVSYLYRRHRIQLRSNMLLQEQASFWHSLIDSLPYPIYLFNNQGQLLATNQAFQACNSALNQDGQQSIAEVTHFNDECQQVISSGQSTMTDRVLALATGEQVTFSHWMVPFYDAEKKIIGVMGGLIDVSQRQQQYHELALAKSLADDASRAKTTFLATMSHEIRTPINAIIGMLELALKKAEKGLLDRLAIEVASGAANNLLGLLGDILDIARIESGRLSLQPERANLRVLVESVVSLFEQPARQKGIRFVLDIDFNFNTNNDVLIDPVRFKQVMSNLLSNAIKFTTEGEVRVSLKSLPQKNDQRLTIWLQIEDSGIGISKQDQAELFTPFHQALNHGQSARNSTGLGLSICKVLCEMMGGKLELHSQLGKGTQVEATFEMQILQPLNLPETFETVVAEPKTLNILVVDDYLPNRMLMLQQLSYLGHEVMDAENGAAGLKLWQSERFDVVITDCNMPVMDGYQLAREIRQAENEQGLAPCLIFGFTANVQPEERANCLAAGMDDCLFKPISLKELNTRLTGIEPEEALSSEIQEDDDIDVSELLQSAKGNDAAVQKLLGYLASSTASDLVLINELLGKKDRRGLSQLAHKVKGGGRMIHAQFLITACEQLETACAQPDEDEMLAAGQRLQQAMKKLTEILVSRG